MVFTSIIFLFVFLPFFLVIYHWVPTRHKNLVALVASLLFYLWGAPKFFWLLIPLLTGNFYVVSAIYKSQSSKFRKTMLWLSLTINLGVLAYFKYANFFIDNVNIILNQLGASSITWVNVLLPIGISFFTFQSITYTLDVYWRKHEPLAKITDYLLYILLFPQLIAGPIIRFNTIANEIKDRRHNFTTDYKLSGVYIFVIGLAKKVLIANQVGAQVDYIFAQADGASMALSWLGIVAYSIQIYFDFSGYSDMAIGLGKIIGFNFPENFKNPYTAESITDFWRKWHITLGAFMRDYLYIPLGGNRSSKIYLNYSNLVVVFLLSGLWHGAAWTFVIWGAWHGLFLMLERAFLKDALQKMPKAIRIFYTYFLVLIGWVFFRAESLAEALAYLGNMFSVNAVNKLATFNLDYNFYLFLGLGLLFAFCTLVPVGKKLENFFYYQAHTGKQHLGLTLSAIALFTLSVSYIITTGFNPFIYFRF